MHTVDVGICRGHLFLCYLIIIGGTTQGVDSIQNASE